MPRAVGCSVSAGHELLWSASRVVFAELCQRWSADGGVLSVHFTLCRCVHPCAMSGHGKYMLRSSKPLAQVVDPCRPRDENVETVFHAHGFDITSCEQLSAKEIENSRHRCVGNINRIVRHRTVNPESPTGCRWPNSAKPKSGACFQNSSLAPTPRSIENSNCF